MPKNNYAPEVSDPRLMNVGGRHSTEVFQYSEGGLPVIFLNNSEKYTGSLKPTR